MDQLVGREVRRLREERGWSQAKLAVAADMSVSGVSQIENGKRNLSTTTLVKLARALDIEVADLFPKEQASLFPERPNGQASEQRREYPYPWMANAFDKLLEVWEGQVERRESPMLSRSIAINCDMASEAITQAADLIGTWGSGELTAEEWSVVEDEYTAFRRQWWEVGDRLLEIARKGLEHYESSQADAEEVRELWELQQRREEIRRRTQELSA